MLVGLAPQLALHVLEETQRALPISALRELLEHEGEVIEGELVFEGVKAPRDAPTRRQRGEAVD